MTKLEEKLPSSVPKEELTEEETHLMDLAAERLASSKFFQKNPEHQEKIWNTVLDLVGMMLSVETSKDEPHLIVMEKTGAENHLKEVVRDWKEKHGIAPQSSVSALRNSARDVFNTVRAGFPTWEERRSFLGRTKRTGYIPAGRKHHTREVQPPQTRYTSLRQKK